MVSATVGQEVRVELTITDAEDDETEAVFVGNLTGDFDLKMEGDMHVFLWTPLSVHPVILRYMKHSSPPGQNGRQLGKRQFQEHFL